jgi:hypothetical protein
MDTHMNVVSKQESEFEVRGSPRISVKIPCALRIHNAVLTARILDLSAGGGFVEFNDPPPAGTEVSIRFRIAGQEKAVDLDLQATVVYAGRFLQGYENFYGFGARFKHMGSTTTAILKEAIQQVKDEPERKYELD